VIELELPYPPSVNHYWRTWRGRMLISREGRRYREIVVGLLATTRTKPMRGALAVRVKVHPPDGRRRDLDNLQKALLDALEHGGAFSDDSQIAKLEVERADVVPGGKVIVEIGERT
jgi:crossover junction endodeoxyribonuclease RusA